MKNNRGYTGVDIVIAISILMILMTTTSVLFTKMVQGMKEIQKNIAVSTYMTQILEEVDIQNYDDVNGSFKNFVVQKYNIPSDNTVEITVNERYTGYIKEVTVSITYEVNNEQQEFEITRLKVLEV